MIETVVVLVIVAVAAFALIRILLRRSRADDSCGECPLKENCNKRGGKKC